MLTVDILCEIMPNLKKVKAYEYIDSLSKGMAEFNINTELRIAAFLAQIAVESGELKWWSEIWGPTEQQKKYEPPTELAKKLGNDQKGDGFKFRGRGLIQITGKANYKKYGDLLNVNLVTNPDLAATNLWGTKIACCYWKDKGLNELADNRNFKEITRRINGGYTHLDKRTEYYERAKGAFKIC